MTDIPLLKVLAESQVRGAGTEIMRILPGQMTDLDESARHTHGSGNSQHRVPYISM